MKCLVCGHEFSYNDICPRCDYAVTFYVDETDELTAQEQERADRYREKLTESVKISVVGYCYDLTVSGPVLLSEENYILGEGQDIVSKTVWLPQKVNRIGKNFIQADVVCELAEKKHQRRISLKADTTEDAVMFGAMLDKDFNLHFFSADSSGMLDDKTFNIFEF